MSTSNRYRLQGYVAMLCDRLTVAALLNALNSNPAQGSYLFFREIMYKYLPLRKKIVTIYLNIPSPVQFFKRKDVSDILC